MDNANCNGGGDLRTPANIVCEFQKGLRKEKAASKSRREKSIILIERSELARGYKLCTLDETEKTWDFYHDLDNYELFDFQRSAEIIKDDITRDKTGYAKQDEALSKLIQESSKQLSELKAKLLKANNDSCAMRNCLQSILGFSDDSVPEQLKAVTDMARSLSEDSQEAAKAMVKIAGIHTFANIGTLKQLSEKFLQDVKELKTLTDGYITSAAEAEKAAQKEVTGIIDELNNEEFQLFEETSILNGIRSTIKFICEGECPPIECVEEICKATTAEETAGPDGGQTKQAKYATGDES